MRVTHVITRLIIGGAQENTIATVLGLGEKPDVQVQLIAGPSTGPEGSLESTFKYRPEVLTILPNLVRPVHPWKDVVAWRGLTRLFREQAPDIVHTHSGKAGILGRSAARRAQVPCIVHTIHGPSFGKFQGAIPNLVFRAAERYAARCTTHFVSVADAMTQQYLGAGVGKPEQFTRIFSGFDLEPFLNARNNPELRKRLGFAADDFVVGKIARLVKLKGHEDLLAAAEPIVKGCSRVKFLLVGDGPLQRQLAARVKGLGLEKYFRFAGLVSPSEIPSLIGIMDVLAHLSKREGLPRALAQALAAGKPVIAADCDGAREVCIPERTGFLIAPGDRNALVQSVLALSANPALSKALGAEGQKLVRAEFSTGRMVDALHALYLKLLGRK